MYVVGTIPYSSFDNFIAPTPPSPRARVIFSDPVHLRAGLAVFSFRNIYDLTAVLDLLTETGDEEISISLCFANEDNIRYVTHTALPSILVAPEIIKEQWWNVCASNTGGKLQYKVRTNNPAETMPLMVLGVYANASNFSLGTLSGGLNLMAFPIYGCAGTERVITQLASLDPPTGDTVIHIGNTGFETDVRELWVAPDLGSPGWDGDPGADTRTTVSLQPVLPIDPARRDATLVGGATRRVANATDSEIETQWGASYGMAAGTWDDRFVRNNAIIITGAFTGFEDGMSIFGLKLNMEIDDAEFTTFQVGFIGSGSPQMGYADRRYWSNSTTDSERFGAEMSFLASNWCSRVGSGTNICDAVDWTPTENGGNTNYAILTVLYRGLTVGDGRGGTYSQPGMSIQVTHVGPPEGEQAPFTRITANGYDTKVVFIEKFIGIPEALSPAPDTYYYPAPQWNETPPDADSIPTNRNSELRRIFTYTDPGKYISRDSGDPLNRRYFAFTVPGFVPAQSESPDYWYLELKTFPRDLRSAKGAPEGGGTLAPGSPNTLTDPDARFISAGVRAGDIIEIYTGKADNLVSQTYTISAVVSQTAVEFSGDISMFGTDVNYFVNYRQNPRGECPIDEWFGGGAPYTGHLTNVNGGKGGDCKQLIFWSAWGPIPQGASSVRVHLPPIGWSANDLVKPGYTVGSDGSTGYIPDFWDGLSADPYFGQTSWSPPRLEWLASIINVNTGALTQAGIGGPLDWNNQNFWQTDLSINYNGQDAWFFYIDFSQ